MSELLRLVNRVFDPVIGRPCWNARLGHGSFLTFEFGQPHLEIHEPQEPEPESTPKVRRLRARRQVFVHGEWHLWIYCCDWVATVDGERVGESGSRSRMENAARELDGQALTGVSGDPGTGSWVFEFDLGGRLETRPFAAESDHYDALDEQWHLYEPTGHIVTVRADGAYCYCTDATPCSRKLWTLPGGKDPAQDGEVG